MRKAPALATVALLVTAAAAASADGPTRGRSDDEALAASCTGCHGDADGVGLPSLAGQSPERLTALLLGYKRGTQQGTLMNRLARGYEDDELRRIAAVLGAGAAP